MSYLNKVWVKLGPSLSFKKIAPKSNCCCGGLVVFSCLELFLFRLDGVECMVLSLAAVGGDGVAVGVVVAAAAAAAAAVDGLVFQII